MNSSSSFSPLWLHRYILFTAVMTVVLLSAGALVTGTGSGLAVPDWPLSFGQFFPPMVGGVLYEHGHRLIAGFVASLTVILAILVHFNESRSWVRNLAKIGVGIVLLQASLGGLTVLLKLPKPVSIAHACLAQIFFCTICSLTLVTSPYWFREKRQLGGDGLRSASVLLVALFFLQLVLGATVRHLGAGLAIPDFPTAFGGLIPPQFDLGIAVHFAHRVGAFTVTLAAALLTFWIYLKHGEHHDIVAFTGMLLTVISFQIMLGATVIWGRRPIPITTAHLVVGALCLAASVILCLGLFRHPKEMPKLATEAGWQGELA